MFKKINLYTDGGCRGNPGIGGWACILCYKEHCKEFSGSVEETTNNRMELTAVIEGLNQLTEPCEVVLYSDSNYVCDGIQKWLPNWINKNWVTAKKEPVKNQDLWQQLAVLLEEQDVTCQWVKGHNGHPENERADELANIAMDNISSK